MEKSNLNTGNGAIKVKKTLNHTIIYILLIAVAIIMMFPFLYMLF